jgi:hypothetical protein
MDGSVWTKLDTALAVLAIRALDDEEDWDDDDLDEDDWDDDDWDDDDEEDEDEDDEEDWDDDDEDLTVHLHSPRTWN